MNLNLQQLEYLVALDTCKSFSEAAKECFVTQPTLSMQIKKLEETIGATLIDRSKQPLAFTDIGQKVVEQARFVLSELKYLEEVVKNYTGSVEGEIKIGIIPTLAPYLVPLFASDFVKKYPKVRLSVIESKTEKIIDDLKMERIDVGILATPLHIPVLTEIPLFYEQFVCYTGEETNTGNSIEIEEVLKHKLWLLSEGNCFRTQTINLCGMNQLMFETKQLFYESGSVEALTRIVDREGGITLIPELATLDYSEEKLDRLKFIKGNPVREISMVISRKKFKRKLIDILAKEIKLSLPEQIKDNKPENVIEI